MKFFTPFLTILGKYYVILQNKTNMTELTSLSYEQNKKYQSAINSGFFDGYEKNPRQWKHTFVGAYVWKYPGRIRALRIFRDMLGRNPEWADLTDTNLKDLVDEFADAGMAPSSIRTLCSELKALIALNTEQNPPSANFRRILSPKGNTSQAVYLTRDEMKRFIEYKTYDETERFVQHNFAIAMLTGARLVDAEQLTTANCDIETGTLSYVPQKTPGIVVTVPVDERFPLRQILADIRANMFPCALSTFNSTVRRICRELGFNSLHTVMRRNKNVTAEKWELVSSHTARRSFATNLYLAGVSLEDVALMMGHGRNIETTRRYICAERPLTPNVMAYFQPNSNEYEPV